MLENSSPPYTLQVLALWGGVKVVRNWFSKNLCFKCKWGYTQNQRIESNRIITHFELWENVKIAIDLDVISGAELLKSRNSFLQAWHFHSAILGSCFNSMELDLFNDAAKCLHPIWSDLLVLKVGVPYLLHLGNVLKIRTPIVEIPSCSADLECF